jgi:hypothetical protein
MKLAKYNNMYIEKPRILKENRGKSGIYMFKNIINGKRYIGSSENLSRRLGEYLSTNYLSRNTCMIICRAFIKYDYSNFSLTILEYCEPDNTNCFGSFNHGKWICSMTWLNNLY